MTQHKAKIQLTSKSNTKSCLTAGLALLFVRGKRRVPAPPPKIIEATVPGSAFGCSSENDEDSNA